MNGPEPGQWYDIEDMVYDSEETEFNNVECPYCGNYLLIEKEKSDNSARISCKTCGVICIYD